MGRLTRTGITGVVLRWASGLRFPLLLILTVVLFAVNVVIPDTLPLVDELLLGLGALLLANLRKKPAEQLPEPDETAEK